MRYILPNKQVIQGDAPFTLNSIQYESVNRLTADERKQLGLTEVVEQPYPTDDFVFVTEDPNKPGNWIVTPFPKERVISELIAFAKDTRWQKEQAGLVVNGALVATDDRSKLLLMGANTLASQNDQYTTVWVNPDGTTTTLNAVQIKAIATAVATFVDNCFNTFVTVLNGIQNGTITTKDQIREAFK